MISNEDKIKTVHTFNTQVMSAVLDGKELEFFDLIEDFFTKRSKANFAAGYQIGHDTGYQEGWADGLLTADRALKGGSSG